MISLLKSWFRRPVSPGKVPEELIFPYSEYLHEISSFDSTVSPATIRRQFPQGERRLFAFQKACQQYPARADLWLANVETRLKIGVYDSWQYEDCIDLLVSAVPFATKPQLRDSIKNLIRDLEEERARNLEEFGQESRVATDPKSLLGLARDGKTCEVLEKLNALKEEVEPKGLLSAGPRDRDLWDTYQAAIQGLFMARDPDGALELSDEFYKRRIELGLTPTPNYTVQELTIGFLLQSDPDRARETINLWLSNSKMPTVCDAVKHHPKLASLFGG